MQKFIFELLALACFLLMITKHHCARETATLEGVASLSGRHICALDSQTPQNRVSHIATLDGGLILRDPFLPVERYLARPTLIWSTTQRHQMRLSALGDLPLKLSITTSVKSHNDAQVSFAESQRRALSTYSTALSNCRSSMALKARFKKLAGVSIESISV